MKKIFLALCLCIGSLLSDAQGLVTANGIKLRTSGNIHVVSSNASLTAAGDADLSSASLVFRGTNTVSLATGSAHAIKSIIVDKEDGFLLLQSEINVGNDVTLVKGRLNLNSHNLQLSPAAVLIGENETARITGPNGGQVIITVPLNAPQSANPGNLGFFISSAANLGVTTIRRGHTVATPNGIERFFDVIPANNIQLNAAVRLHYLDVELSGTLENALTVFQKEGSLFKGIGRDTANTATNIVGKNNVFQLTSFTLASPTGSPLPVNFISFAASCTNGKTTLAWQTAQEVNTKSFAIERSVNGSSWEVMGEVQASGSAGSVTVYSFISEGFTGWFRIVGVDLDGKKTFSPIAKSSCASLNSITVYPNPAHSSANISITSSEAGTARVLMYDAKGRLVKQLQKTIVTGRNQIALDVSALPAGVYLLLVQNGATEQKITLQKF